MAGIADYIIDNGINAIDTLAQQISICSADPLTFAQAVAGSPDISFMLGAKDFGSAGAASGSPFTLSPDIGGRWIATTAVTSGSPGSFVQNGTASHWALVDLTNSRLLAHAALSATLSVNAGDTFTLPSFLIHMPNT